MSLKNNSVYDYWPNWVAPYPDQGWDRCSDFSTSPVIGGLTKQMNELKRQLDEANAKLAKYQKEETKEIEAKFAEVLRNRPKFKDRFSVGVKYDPTIDTFYVYTFVDIPKEERIVAFQLPDRNCKVEYVTLCPVGNLTYKVETVSAVCADKD